MLAAKILIAQGIEVIGICFTSNFFGCANAEKSAQNLGIKLIKADIHKDMISLVKNPAHGYGKNLNPCIDCHGNMFYLAAQIARERKIDFIASGEVLGQRPFSQNKQALLTVEKLAGVSVLRPLSAKLLPITEMEKNGLVKRSRLAKIEGRNRQEQLRLAQKFNIENFPSPAGGCLLTDPGFSERLGKMLDYWPDCSENDIELLKYGRIFWLIFKKNGLTKKILVVVGRHKADNDRLDKLAKTNDFMLQLKELNGPLVLLRFPQSIQIFHSDFPSIFKVKTPEKLTLSLLKLGEKKNLTDILTTAGTLCAAYSVKARGKEVWISVKHYL